MADHLTLFEVGPRDGLQNEARLVATRDKIALVDSLSLCGFAKIEVTSFVSPKWVPQLADAGAVMAGITRRPGTSYAALTPNLKGYQAALAARADEVAIFASASEGFSRRNINCSIAESLDRFRPLLLAAQVAGIPVRGYVSCICDCPYDGPTSPSAVAKVTGQLIAMGCYEVSLGDTIGRGTPQKVAVLLDAVLELTGPSLLAGHFHDTDGRAADNIRLCLGRGLRTFDASVAGFGGCPFAPGARGNVATETVLALAEAEGLSTGIDRDRLAAVATFARTLRSTP